MTTPASSTRSLGTKLRHLSDLLDQAVAARYHDDGMADYRPRFTPIMRCLLAEAPQSIATLASKAGLTHSACSQTVAQMRKAGFVASVPGKDAREQLVSLTPRGRKLRGKLEAHWIASKRAADALDAELPYPLSRLLDEAIAALEREPHSNRLAHYHPKSAP